MYTFQEKRKISSKIADMTQIPRYREMLQACNSPASSTKMVDKQELAVFLVYNLLDSYSEEEISRRMESAPAFRTAGTNSQPFRPTSKKKQNLRNIPISNGTTWRTIWSRLRSFCIRTASTATEIWSNLKNHLRKRK